MYPELTVQENHVTPVHAFVRPLCPDEINKIMTLQQEVYDALADKQIYVTSSKEEILDEIKQYPDHVLGVLTDSGQLIALGIYKTVGQDIHNYGRDFGLDGPVLDQIGHVDTTIVDSRFRGNHLQKLLIDVMEAKALRDGMHMMCATVSPYNPYSLNTFLKAGYVIRQDQLKYGGVRRYTVAKQLI